MFSFISISFFHNFRFDTNSKVTTSKLFTIDQIKFNHEVIHPRCHYSCNYCHFIHHWIRLSWQHFLWTFLHPHHPCKKHRSFLVLFWLTPSMNHMLVSMTFIWMQTKVECNMYFCLLCVENKFIISREFYYIWFSYYSLMWDLLPVLFFLTWMTISRYKTTYLVLTDGRDIGGATFFLLMMMPPHLVVQACHFLMQSLVVH